MAISYRTINILNKHYSNIICAKYLYTTALQRHQPQQQQQHQHQYQQQQCRSISTTQHNLTHAALLYLQNQTNTNEWVIDNPYNCDIAYTVKLHNHEQTSNIIQQSYNAYNEFKNTTLEQRITILNQFIQLVQQQNNTGNIAHTITNCMGKPLKQSYGEIQGMIARINSLIDIAKNCNILHTEHIDTASHKSNIHKYINKEPIGPVLLLCPWNYPLLTAINSIATAILCGCSIIIKHSDRTAPVADILADLFKQCNNSNKPDYLVQSLHINHNQLHSILQDNRIKYVQFTGSVNGGDQVYKTIANTSRFIDVGLELGGKDAAYITENITDNKMLDYTAENIVDGALYNAGQSCCAIERVYVHKKYYNDIIDRIHNTLKNNYKLGSPTDERVNLGPIAQPNHTTVIQRQVHESITQGAKLVYGGHIVHDNHGLGRFYEPTLVINCNNTMPIMTDETFGPVIAIQQIDNDQQAIQYINNNQYGLTASIWSNNVEQASSIGQQLDVGTVYMNRSDYLDPYLPWSGRKNSGKGYGLSHYGFLPYLRTKSYNFKVQV